MANERGWGWWLLGFCAACIGGMIVVLILIHISWVRWGVFGMLLFFFGLALIAGWFYDRRQQKRYADIPD